MGDHRADSLDSRAHLGDPGGGIVPIDKVHRPGAASSSGRWTGSASARLGLPTRRPIGGGAPVTVGSDCPAIAADGDGRTDAMTTEDGPRASADLPVEPSPPRPAPSRRRAGAERPPGAVRTRRAKPKHKSFLRELPGIVITALVISVLIKTFLVQAFYIPSGSMENTLLVNDRVLVNKLADKPDEIHRGDVDRVPRPGRLARAAARRPRRAAACSALIRDGLVFVGLAPAAGEEDLIKRVIGVGGDKVVCCDDQRPRHRQRRAAGRAVPLPRRRAVRRDVPGHRARRTSSG